MDQNQKKIESRREFLKATGKFAVYTPPALILMTKPSHANFTESICVDTNNNELSSGSSGSNHGWLQDLVNELLK